MKRVFALVLVTILTISKQCYADYDMEDLLSDVAYFGGITFGADERCYVKCDKALTAKQGIPTSAPSEYGCGAYGMHLTGIDEGLEDCCIEHDHCYEQCGASKASCDSQLKLCIMKRCDELKTTEPGVDLMSAKDCCNIAKMFTGLTGLFGCNTFLNTQADRCLCGSDPVTNAVQE